MKKQDSVGIGCSLIVTLTFVVIEIILFQMSSSWNLILLFPIFGIGYGLYLTIKAYLKQSYREASEAIQNSKANSIKYDSTFGKEELKLYFDNENKRITIIATNGYISDQKEVEEFVRYQEVETDDYIESIGKTIKLYTANGDIDDTCTSESYGIKYYMFYSNGVLDTEIIPDTTKSFEFFFILPLQFSTITITTLQ